MTNEARHEPAGERGIALITALLATMLLLALGVAVVSSTTTDTTTTKVQRVGEQAFFIADAGIGIARRTLTEAFEEEIDKIRKGETAFYSAPKSAGQNVFPDFQVVPPYDGTWNNSFYKSVRDRAIELATMNARKKRFEELNGSNFTVEYELLSADIQIKKTGATGAIEYDTFNYLIKVTGATGGGGKAMVNETGKITITITLATDPGEAARNFAFSGFGAFFDDGDTAANAALASGTFTGPVHTNTHFAFSSDRSVTFRNAVTQVDSKMRYNSWSSTSPNQSLPNGDIKGIDISSDGYKQTSLVPLPDNNFSQELAVINSTGITDKNPDGTPVDPPGAMPRNPLGIDLPIFDGAGRVTADALRVNLRNASNAMPTLSGGALPTGVYISSADGTAISGAGIYVQGDASDIQLYADTNGDQVYVIKQGGTTTTVRTSFANNTTRISSGAQSKTYVGVFTDKGDPAAPKPGALLFVNGSINSLRGGKSGATNNPAIAPNTALTITAQRHITITGDLKYDDPVANADGTPVSNLNATRNVLGIFTNDGNVNLNPQSSYISGSGLSLEVNAAIVAFNKNKLNDGGKIEGSITFTGDSDDLSGTDRWRLVGSRGQSKINNIAYSKRDIFFDVRFSGGKFAPPFFPGTSYSLDSSNGSTDVAISSVDAPTPTAMSWFRDND